MKFAMPMDYSHSNLAVFGHGQDIWPLVVGLDCFGRRLLASPLVQQQSDQPAAGLVERDSQCHRH